MSSSYLMSLFEKDDCFKNTGEIETVRKFLLEFHYATKYLSKTIKVRPFIIYLVFFKKAYFEEGKREIYIKLSEIGENILSDRGNPMTISTVKRGVDELVRKDCIRKISGKTGEINGYEVKVPSEIREIRELIDKDINSNENQVDEDLVDYYTNNEKRLSILERDNYKCSYCLKEVSKDDFHLDHIVPRSKGGFNYRTNLLLSCRSCNTNKNDKSVDAFLLSNYRNGLLLQDEYLRQLDKIKELSKLYEGTIENKI